MRLTRIACSSSTICSATGVLMGGSPWCSKAGNKDGLVQEAGLASVEAQLVAVVGVGDGDQAAGSLVEACSAQRGDAVFGDNVIDGVFQGGDDAARGEGGADAAAAAAGGGVQHQERFAAGGIHGAAGEVGLAARGRPVAPGNGFAGGLAHQVDFGGRVD